MQRARAVLVVLAIAVAGCGPAAVEPTTTTTTQAPMTGAESPAAALSGLLKGVQDGNIEAASTMTIATQVALLIALDGATASEARSFLDDGVPKASRSMFWDSFRDTYSSSFGEDVSDMVIATGGRIMVDFVSFTLVSVSLRESDGQTRWITRLGDDGRWRVDLFATFASTFAQPLRLWLYTLHDNDDAAIVREAVAAQKASLLAAIDQEPLGPISEGVAGQIRGLLTDVGAG